MTAKLTVEEYDSRLLERGLLYVRTGEYLGRLIRTEHMCTICETVVLKEPKRILAGTGCRVCATNKSRKSAEEYDIEIKNSTFERIDAYINMLTSINHRCKKCGEIFKVIPASITAGHGCKYCENRVPLGTDNYIAKLPKNIQCLGEYSNNKDLILHKCNICSTEWEASPNNILSKDSGCPNCAKNINCSKAETELVEYIKSNYNGWIIEHDRKMLEGKELDIILPDLGLAIEYNGTYWHSDKFTEKTFHLDKTNKIEEYDYQLIHIFEHIWNNKKNIVKSRINNFLGINEKIYARKCSIIEINNTRKFLEDNHIQGYCTSSINLGLVYNNVLVAIMTFGEPRFNKNYKFELLRYCSVINTNVIGGAGKLLKYFRNKYSGSIISYADRAWSRGSLYKALGFTFIENTKPNYTYHNGTKVLTRYQCQKHKLVELGYSEELTEEQIMKLRNFNKVYDCGSQVWGL